MRSSAQLNQTSVILGAHDFTVFQFFHKVVLEIEFSRTRKIKEEHSCRFFDDVGHVGCFRWFHYLGVFFMKISIVFREPTLPLVANGINDENDFTRVWR